ncbi:MAG: ATP-binding protein [Pseudomonadota bacterium]
MLINLIKNSIDAITQDPLESKSLELHIRLSCENTMVRLEVEDNGPGIDEKVRKRIFEPFFTTKSVDKGTGLGLSISYFIIVDEHKGTMEVESAPGRGARFIVKLPVSTD